MKLILKSCLLLGLFFNLATGYTQNTITLTPAKDNSIFSENASNSNGVGKLFVGQTCQDDLRRALVQFDLSSIPAGSTITEVALTLGAETSGEEGEGIYSIYAAAQDWGEGTSSGSGRGAPAVAPDATWTYAMFGTAFWSMPGGDFNPAELTYLFISENNQSVTFPSTGTMVMQTQIWLDNPAANFGIIIIGNEDISCSAYRFGSKDSGVAPTLTVSYEEACNAVMTEETYMGCLGDGYNVIVNGTIYNENNTTGTETLTSNAGCDSIVTIDLFFDFNPTGTEIYEGCEGDGYTVEVGGTSYNENNPNGSELLTSSTGCDSIVTIDLIFGNNVTGEETYTGCNGDGYSVTVNGINYNENNPSGLELLTSSTGCDSIVTIDLIFGDNVTGEETYTGCNGDDYSVTVNGTTYNENNPNGSELLTSSTGCDSIVTIDLIFGNNVTGEETYTGCNGDGYSVTVNGINYNENNPSGLELLTSSTGCDSIVTIDLIFGNNVTGEETYTGCNGDGYSVTVNGINYNENNPSGSELLTSSTGCDSIVTIDLIFGNNVTGEETYTGCNGDDYSVTVNGTTYNENNPNGSELLTSSTGCDSIVTIDLIFGNNITVEETYTGCNDDGYSITVNGTTYNEGNPIGTETLLSTNNCDSIVNITLIFGNNFMTDETYEGCEGDGFSVIINGTTYDESNSNGMEVLVASNGCDSTVMIDFIFKNNATRAETYTGCSGDDYSVTVNGTTYNENNPSGTEILVANNNCDSTVIVDLVFNNHPVEEETYTGCFGDGYSVTVNGTIYNESNPSGVEMLVASTGCDSTIMIDLIFGTDRIIEETYMGCQGDGYGIFVNGTLYDEDNPTGTEMLSTGNQCDTIITIDLVFGSNILVEENYAGCRGDGYSITIGGIVYNENNPGGAVVLVASNGCDSIVSVNLFFRDVDNSVTVDAPSITANAIGTYQWVDCDDNNQPISGATDQTFTATESGNYAVMITQSNCIVTSDCNMITVVNTENTIIDQQVTLFPNPTNGRIQMTFGDLNGITIKLRDITGKLLLEMSDVNPTTQQLEIPGPAGVYLLEVRTEDVRGQFRVIKQ